MNSNLYNDKTLDRDRVDEYNLSKLYNRNQIGKLPDYSMMVFQIIPMLSTTCLKYNINEMQIKQYLFNTYSLGRQ